MTSLHELIETARRIHEIESPEERTRFNGLATATVHRSLTPAPTSPLGEKDETPHSAFRTPQSV